MVEYLAGNRIRGTSTEKTALIPAVTLDGTPVRDSIDSGVTSLSESITVGDHTNKALVCCIYRQGGGASGTTAVKVGTNAFTPVQQTFGGSSGTGTQTTEIWILLNSGITNDSSNQVDWTGTGSAGGVGRVGIGIYSLYNVNQGGGSNTFVGSTAYGTIGAGVTASTNGVVNSVASGDFILDNLGANSNTQPTDSLTEGWNEFVKTNRYFVSQYNASPSTNNNMFYSNVTGAEWSWSGARIKKIAGGSPTDGSIFYETDNNKSYVLSSNVWTEL
tara:strand:- start:193 stop:1014 length:822 start_codon:yes stop_codon:yes gene_type:complete